MSERGSGPIEEALQTWGAVQAFRGRIDGFIKAQRRQEYDPHMDREVGGKAIAIGGALLGAVVVMGVVASQCSVNEKEVPKQAVTVDASECDSYEQSVENLFRDVAKQAQNSNFFVSNTTRLNLDRGFNTFAIETKPDARANTTSITLMAAMGGAEEASSTGSFILINTNPAFEPGKPQPGINQLLDDPATYLAGVSFLSDDIQGRYAGNGELVTFKRGATGCEIAADPHGLKGINGEQTPGVAAAAQFEINALTTTIRQKAGV